EHGFSGWTDLKRELSEHTAATVKSLDRFENMAEALLEAYRTGSAAAMERHWALTWHRRNHQAMRTYVQLDLGRQSGAANQNDDITIDDARFRVAGEHGFAGWDALVTFYASVSAPKSLITAKPVRILATENITDESESWHSRDWNAVVERLKESTAIGIDAG